MNNQYDNLRHGAPARLRNYKVATAKSLETVAKHHGTDSALYKTYLRDGWKGARWVTPHGMGFKFANTVSRAKAHGHNCIHMDSDALDHLRVNDVDNVLSLNHSGWYCDDDCRETISGRVVALPGGRFLAFIVWSECDGITVEDVIHDSERDAAVSANEMARIFAEHEREYRETESRAATLEDGIEEAKTELENAIGSARYYLETLRVAQAPGFVPKYHTPEDFMDRCRAMRRDAYATARRALTDIRKAREELEALRPQLQPE